MFKNILMKQINQNQIFYKKKRNFQRNKKIRPNKNISLIIPKSNFPNIHLFQKKNLHLFSPISNSNNQKISASIKSFNQGLPNKNKNTISFFNSNTLNNNIYDNILNYNTISEITNDNLFLERPKVNIRVHSTKHNDTNRNTISSEKNNSPIKYKIHRIKPKNLKYSENSAFTPSQSRSTINQNKINYSLINSIQNSFDSTDTNVTNKNKEYAYINYYYNIMQEKSLKTLNNNIENLIKEQTSKDNKITRNNLYLNKLNIHNKILNKSKKNNYCINQYKKIVYKRKIQGKKNNNSDTFSELTFLNSDKESEKKYMNKNNDFSNNKRNLDKLIFNDFKNRNTYDIISYNYQTPSKSEIFANNGIDFDGIHYSNKHSSILMPTFSYHGPKIRKNKEYIKIENYNNNLIINNSNKGNTINFMEPIITQNKIQYEDTGQNYSSQSKFNSVLFQKSFDFNSTKNSTSNIMIKKKIKENKKNLFNYYKKNNWDKINKAINSINISKNDSKNNNLNNNKLIYSTNFSDYNTINDFNFPEKKLQKYFKFKKSITNDLNECKKSNQENINPDKPSSKQQLLNKKDNRCNKFKPTKLKNVITSIQCKSKIKDNEEGDKNIILSELDNNGKLNVKVKKLKKSIEKVLKENPNRKIKNIYYLGSNKAPSETLKYVKKNQGTHISKTKKNDNNNE